MNQASPPPFVRPTVPEGELAALAATPAPPAADPLPPRPRRVDRIASSVGPLARKQWLGRDGSRAAEREFRRAERLLERGVRAPLPIGWLAATRERPAVTFSAWIEGARELADAWERATEGGATATAPRDARRARRRLLSAVGLEVAALHRAGYAHGDLHARNVLVDARGDAWFVDLARLRRAGRSAQQRDLHALYHHFAWRTSARERLEFATTAEELPRDRVARHRRLRALAAAAERSRQRFLRHHERRCDGSGRAFAPFDGDRVYGVRRADLPEELRAELEALLRGELAALPDALRAAGATPIHATATSALFRLERAGRALALKWFDDRGPLRRLLRGSRAARAWRNAFRFEMAQLPTPRAWLFAQDATGARRPSSVLVTDFVDDAPRLADALTGPLAGGAAERGANRPPRLAPPLVALAAALARLHDEGLSHRDLKAENVLLPAAGGVAFIDLDGVRRRPATLDRVARDLMRLNASFRDPRTVTWRLRLAFLAEYRQARRLQRPPWRALRDAVARRTADKWLRQPNARH
ncbi:MAG: hypothetical protein JNL90_10380 [Planctomycetes bacterium]|nr:hypothetical protein [Planctomycetota bacterium]